MRRTNKIWKMNKKQFWQIPNEQNAAFKVTENLIMTYNGVLIMSKTAFEVFDEELDATVLVTTHGVVNIEKSKGDWQMYRR